MTKLPKPRIDIPFRTGARLAWDVKTLEEAFKSNEVKDVRFTKVDKECFIRGFYTGRCTDAINDFQGWMRFMDEDQIIRVGNELIALRDAINKELSSDAATYKHHKIKGLPRS